MKDNLAIKHYWYSSETINFINSNNYLVYSIKRGSFIANLQNICTGTTGIDFFGWNSRDNWKGKKALLTKLFSFTSLHVQQWIYLYLVIYMWLERDLLTRIRRRSTSESGYGHFESVPPVKKAWLIAGSDFFLVPGSGSGIFLGPVADP